MFLIRLYSPALPEDAPKLTHLANTYFAHIHPLRTLAFIHRPTFMQSLDSRQVEDDYGTALVHIMFALASRYVSNYVSTTKCTLILGFPAT